MNPLVFFSAAHVQSPAVRSLFADQLTMAFYSIYNPLSFLNLVGKSSSDFCLPCEKRASFSRLGQRAASKEKSTI